MAEQLIVRRRAPAARAGGATFAVIDPSTGEPLAEVAKAGAGRRRRRAVDLAHRAFDDGRGAWAARPPRRAAGCCSRSPQLLRERDRGARHGSRPPAPATRSATPAGRSSAAARTFEYYAGAANKHLGPSRAGAGPGSRRRAARAGRACAP